MDNKCNLCHDRGIILKGDYAKVCPCTKQKAMVKKVKSSQLTKEMLNHSFNSFNLDYYSNNHFDNIKNISYRQMAQQALEGAEKFMLQVQESPNTDGIILSGPVGCGKTFLASCVANSLMDKGMEVLFVVVPDLLDEIKATYDNNYSSQTREQELLDSARQVQVLILDDLGAHNYTDWTRNKIYSIINYRLNQQLPTIITTNLSLEELELYVGDRTTSRIIQMSKLYRLLVDTDIRIVKRQEKEMVSWKERN